MTIKHADNNNINCTKLVLSLAAELITGLVVGLVGGTEVALVVISTLNSSIDNH